MYLLGEVQEGDVSVVESRLHFPPLSDILYEPHLKQIMTIITMEEMLFLIHTVYQIVNIERTGLYITNEMGNSC